MIVCFCPPPALPRSPGSGPDLYTAGAQLFQNLVRGLDFRNETPFTPRSPLSINNPTVTHFASFTDNIFIIASAIYDCVSYKLK